MLLFVYVCTCFCKRLRLVLYSHLNDFVYRVLGVLDVLDIPPYANGGLMIDYVPRICEMLTNKVVILLLMT